MPEGILNMPVFRLHIVMFCVIVTNICGIFRVPKWLEDNLPSFEYFRKITIAPCLGKATRGRDSLFSSLLMRFNTDAPWITTSTIQTNGNHHHFFIYIPILGHVRINSVDKTHVLVVTTDLVVVLEYIFSTLFQHRINLLGSQDSEKLCKSHCCRSNQPLSKLHYCFAWCTLLKVVTFFFF